MGRPCGKCLRASVKAEHIHLSLRPCGGGEDVTEATERKEKRERERVERMDRGRSGVRLAKLLVIFHPDLYLSPAPTCLPSTTCFLFVPVDLIPPTSPPHISSLLCSLFLWFRPPLPSFISLDLCCHASPTFRQLLLFFSVCLSFKK